MKRLIALVILAVLAYGAFAQDSVFPTLQPKNAKTMALGGAFSALPTAEFSFFGNPAAFGARRASLTIASVDTWAYFKPTTANINSLSNMGDNPLGVIGGLMPGNGIGGGASLGFGYAGRGLGLGLFATSDEYASGDSLPGAVLSSDTQINAIIGLGVPLINTELLRLVVGGNLRPFYRIRTETALADALGAVFQSDNSTGGNSSTAFMDTLIISSGFGLAMDLGATLELGALTVGLSIRDIAPSFRMWEGTLTAFTDALDAGNLPKADATNSTNATFLPNIAAGVSWKPRIIPGLLDPALYFEIQDPVSVLRDNKSVTNLLHAGAELKLLSLVTLRGGINRGWLSAGAGFKLLIIDVNAAIFTEELGALPGDKPRSGFSLQAAIRF